VDSPGGLGPFGSSSTKSRTNGSRPGPFGATIDGCTVPFIASRRSISSNFVTFDVSIPTGVFVLRSTISSGPMASDVRQQIQAKTVVLTLAYFLFNFSIIDESSGLTSRWLDEEGLGISYIRLMASVVLSARIVTGISNRNNRRSIMNSVLNEPDRTAKGKGHHQKEP